MIEKSDIKFSYSMSNKAILQTLGKQIRQMRLNKNLTQTELGKSAGLSRSAISTMENKGLGSMNSFVQIIRTLEKIEILNHFITEAPVSPRQIAKLRGKTRERASGSKSKQRKEDAKW
jgi:transcriptional regulator with XRE-family HTH domain